MYPQSANGYPPQYPPQYSPQNPPQYVPGFQPNGAPAEIGYRPRWAQEMITLFRGRIARQFVLHFNINDFAITLSDQKSTPENGVNIWLPSGEIVGVQDQPSLFRAYLHDLLYSPRFNCQAIYTYTLASGLIAEDRERNGIGQPLTAELQAGMISRADALIRSAVQAVGVGRRRQGQQQDQQGQPPRQPGQRMEGEEVDMPKNVPDNLKALGHLLRTPYYPNGMTKEQAAQQNIGQTPVAVILDYVEKLVPFQVGEGQGTTEQLQALEVIQSWALDPVIRETDNAIILLTTNVGQLPASITAEGSGCRAIRVPLPNTNERGAFIRHKTLVNNPRYRLATLAPTFSSKQPITDADVQSAFTRTTQGMRLMDIDNLNRRVIMERRTQREPEIIFPADVRREKAETIQSQSSQLLEVIPPERGFNEIGGMEELKVYLRKRTALMRAGRHAPLIPSGLLLAGPPGTGKTVIAEALALEGGFNLVKMRNIQDRWVGSSERNLDMVISLLQDLHPVIVFVDEIDQAMGRRDAGQNGDSGVSARMFARILEEMSKASNRGKIMWVAATNRTDYLDDALLRRFDRVVPLLAPDALESRRIFATMPNAIRKQSGGALSISYGGDLLQSNREIEGRASPTNDDLSMFQHVAERSAEMGLTGAEIEIVVRRAIEIACEQYLDAGTLSDTDLPPITSAHLFAAMGDFKLNHNPYMYDFQSLLAIRSCNFYSTLPAQLPNRAIFANLRGADGRIDPDQLDAAIRWLAMRVNGGSGAGGPNDGPPPAGAR